MSLTDKQRARQARARAHWDPPGPMPPGAGGAPDLSPADGETLDAFAGHWRIFQLRGGHRYSTDDLLAAYFAVETLRGDPAPELALDLGSGIGSVGLFLAWKYPGLRLHGLEIQPRSLALAQRSARYNGCHQRVDFHLGDLNAGAEILPKAALITASPPYWHPDRGVVSDAPQKGACRFELVGTVEAYARAARDRLLPGGRFILVFDGRQRPRLEAALREAGLFIHRLQEVISREGDAPLLVLAAAGLEKAKTNNLPPLLLRTREGKRSPAFRAIRLEMGLPPGPV